MAQQRKSNGLPHNVLLWMMVILTAFLTLPHLAQLVMIFLVEPKGRMVFALVFFYAVVAGAWKIIMAYDVSDGWPRKRVLLAAWTVLFMILVNSPFSGKGFLLALTH